MKERNMVQKFIKLPVEIEAIQFTGKGDNAFEIAKWMGSCSFTLVNKSLNDEQDYYQLVIKTPEGTMYASIGDWIIKGIEGEFYPCKPAIFKKTYQLKTMENE